MITIEKMFKHMAWANTEILTQVASMPDEALDSYVVNPEWTAREIIYHIVRSAHFYGYRLQIGTPRGIDAYESRRSEYIDNHNPPIKSSQVLDLVELLKKADQILLTESMTDDAIIPREEEDSKIGPSRSTVLFQAIHHATEHRAQLVLALEARGFSSINLDDFDLWGYANKFGQL